MEIHPPLPRESFLVAIVTRAKTINAVNLRVIQAVAVITSVTDSKNYTIYSVYDALGRIKFTKEKDLNGNFNILTEGHYNTLSN
jgi:hypothetical protein